MCASLSWATRRPRASSQQLIRAICRCKLTADNRVYRRSFSFSRYDSANGANGPVIKTLLTLLVGLLMLVSFSRNPKETMLTASARYADLVNQESLPCNGSRSHVGITRRSA